MKINLVYGNKNKEIFPEYLTIDTSLHAHLDDVCEGAECTSIIANDVIDYFSAKEVGVIIEHWLSKLRHEGKIIIGGTDINEVSKGIYNKHLSLIESNVFLYGEQNEPWEYKKSCLTASELAKSLQSLGLKILKNRTNNYRYVIEAERP